MDEARPGEIVLFCNGDDYHQIRCIEGGKVVTFFKERTCKRISYDGNGKPQLICSACGCGMGKAIDRHVYVNYCPACGAKVIKDES